MHNYSERLRDNGGMEAGTFCCDGPRDAIQNFLSLCSLRPRQTSRSQKSFITERRNSKDTKILGGGDQL